MELGELLVAEYGLIAALYNDLPMLDAVSIMPSDFFQDDCSSMLSAMRSGVTSVPGLASRTGLGLDMIENIIQSNVGGSISELVELVSGEARRRSLSSAIDSARMLLSSEVGIDTIVTSLELDIQACESSRRDDKVDSKDLAEIALKRAEDAANGVSSGVPFGFRLSDVLHGLPVGVVSIIGADTSTGKTAFALDILLGAARLGHHVVMHSLEDSEANIASRIACKISGIPLDRIRSGRMSESDWGQFYKAMNDISSLPLAVVTRPMSVEEMCYEMRRSHRQHKTRVYCIDYAQVMRSQKHSKQDDAMLSDAMISLKETAKICDMCVLLLSQVRRPREGSDDREIHRGMLKNSSALEQGAHVIILLERDRNGFSKDCKIKVDKNKDGKAGKEAIITMQFDGPTGRFADDSKGLAESEWNDSH